MTPWKLMTFGLVALLPFSIMGFVEASANADSLDGKGAVTVEGSVVTPPVDPENPGNVIDPGDGPSTEGALRIDYVSSLDFLSTQITKTNRIYSAAAQQFFSDTGPRGSYIQITDQRAESTGWTIQVKQNYQFKNAVIQEPTERELQGAVLSLDKAWANSSGTSQAPTVTRETIALNGIGTAYELARADAGNGRGVWTIAFGASEANTSNQTNTLSPILDEKGDVLIDPLYQKPIYSNSAITLTIPDSTKIHPVQYDTEITWILGALP